MKINTETGINTYLGYIYKIINKNIDNYFHRDIQNAIEAVNKIWSKDIVVKNYTSHKLDHNIRVLYYCYKLIEICNIKLDKTGYYILTLAALLHDFGMQCTDKSIIEKYAVNDLELIEEDYEITVRKNHARICVDWIEKLYISGETDSAKLISLIDARLMKPICDAIMYHSGNELYELKENLVYYNNNIECNLMTIVLILRLADELDIGSERSTGELSLLNELDIDNVSYFWLHYITQISFVSNNILKIVIETHPNDKDKHDFFVDKIYNTFMLKNTPLLEMLVKYSNVHLSIECETKTNGFLKEFNPSVYDYLLSKSIKDSSYFDNMVQVTYNVPDIGEIYDLDYKLLPMLYKDYEPNYAVTKEQAYECVRTNPYMTIAAYKHNKPIGYLTLWPVSLKILDKLLNFEILESDVDFDKDIFTYNEKNINICWYVSGLGISNEERGRKNDPIILQQLLDNAVILANNVLKPNNIVVDRIGAVVYTHTAENLCLRHFGMKVYKNATHKVEGYTPKSVCVEVNNSMSYFINKLNATFS